MHSNVLRDVWVTLHLPVILLAQACHLDTSRQDAEKYSFSLLGGVEKLPGIKCMCIGSYGELGPML